MAVAQSRGIVAGLGSPPLPYLDIEISPAATPATFVPAALERDASEPLKAALSRLPFSVVHLPVATLRSPWWLVFVAHEVGHCVLGELGLLEPWKKHLRDAVTPGVGAADADLFWARWAEEIFADYFSLLMLGPAALRCLIEFELKSAAGMRRRPLTYPPAAVRLALLAALLDKLGFDGKGALCGVDPAEAVKGDAAAEKDLSMVDVVAAAVRADLPGLPGNAPGERTLEALCRFKKDDVTARIPPPGAVPRPPMPRQIVIASIERWDTLERLPVEADRQAGRAALAGDLLTGIAAVHLPGKRSGNRSVDAGQHGRDLCKALLSSALPGEDHG
jgi:hypothetical protein